MNTDPRRSKPDADSELSGRVIGCAYAVSNGLGCGFLDKVYENALRIELSRAGLPVRQQCPRPVAWRGETVGCYFPDRLIESRLLVEVKAARALDDAHLAQCLNYLKATGLRLCLLLNFGRPRVEVRRVISSFDQGQPADDQR